MKKGAKIAGEALLSAAELANKIEGEVIKVAQRKVGEWSVDDYEENYEWDVAEDGDQYYVYDDEEQQEELRKTEQDTQKTEHTNEHNKSNENSRQEKKVKGKNEKSESYHNEEL